MWESRKTQLIGAVLYLALAVGFLLVFTTGWQAVRDVQRWLWCGGP